MQKAHLVAVAAAIAVASALVPLGRARSADRSLPAGARFFVPAPDAGALRQGLDLVRSHDLTGAVQLAAMVAQGHAVWFTSGSPQDVRRGVAATIRQAALERRVPVLVAYDVPFRDCGQYSSGGARSTADYLAWIDGFAAGIGDGKAVVVLEPDGLGLAPNEGCTPSASDLAAAGLTLAQAEQARYDQLNGAVDRLEQQPGARVYLDATHPGWLNVGDASQRLLKAGVQRAQGFFLNASNYHWTANDTFYGTWISDCIAYATQIAPQDFGGCPNQYWDGGPNTSWTGDALDTSQVWSDQPYSGNAADLKWNTTGIDSRWASILGAVAPSTHFVIDTSRNGRGPWVPTVSYPDKQDWCNPPGRGLGPRPSTSTGNSLVDAYLWIKVPGESDGACNRGVAGSSTDPEWGGILDPAAGAWFPQQALQLARLASPPLLP
jgi:endoglucanase